ncbi:EEF1A lysine methyltransferase 2 [Chelonus insularis]|uniref:EEF1A lysine methyltransferase 2 n=1 Tax=Chelonus insularis TaxID=460826 RepID=UPI00158E32DA|nr:EEF1A lysine methyltransferase 2 [Chelonus insularis]
MSEELSGELNSSELGTYDYWENIYNDEINNFQEYGDIGEVWFGKKNAENLIKCIEELNIEKTDKIIDLGCGNGWTLVQLLKRGFKNLYGVDYSPKAIKLARAILNDNQIDEGNIKLIVGDILNVEDSGIENERFTLIHDKGTYDAISLNPDNHQEQRKKYINNVTRILKDTGFFVISSCNWTKDELQEHFKNDFKVERSLETPKMSFGGKVGQSVTNMILRKKKNK